MPPRQLAYIGSKQRFYQNVRPENRLLRELAGKKQARSITTITLPAAKKNFATKKIDNRSSLVGPVCRKARINRVAKSNRFRRFLALSLRPVGPPVRNLIDPTTTKNIKKPTRFKVNSVWQRWNQGAQYNNLTYLGWNNNSSSVSHSSNLAG